LQKDARCDGGWELGIFSGRRGLEKVKDRKMLYIFLKHYWNKKLNGGMIYYVRSD
jgi:hypothetical protein